MQYFYDHLNQIAFYEVLGWAIPAFQEWFYLHFVNVFFKGS